MTLVCAPVYAAAAAAPPVSTRVAICVSLETAPPRLTRRSSSAIWRAEWCRSAGSLESDRITTCSSPSDTSRFCFRIEGGGSDTCFIAISTAESPVNGSSPVSIS